MLALPLVSMLTVVEFYRALILSSISSLVLGENTHAHINSRGKGGLSTNSRTLWISIIMEEVF